MARERLSRIGGVVGVSLSLLLGIVIGCGKEQAPAPAPAPVAAPAAVSVPAGAIQTPPAAMSPVQSASQIQIGMTGEQVQQIMGAPGQIKQEGAELEWKYFTPQGKVEVKMSNNRVSAIERK